MVGLESSCVAVFRDEFVNLFLDDVSTKAGERVLLPAVRAAGDDVQVLADGFSCRHQIMEGSGRRALHLAEVIDRGLGHVEPEAHSGPARGIRRR